MKLYQIFLYIEIQGDYKVVYYDYEKDERIEVDPQHYTDKEVAYMYTENNTLYIEIDNE